MGFVYNSVICPILHINFIAMLLTIRCKRKNESITLSEFYCFTMYILTWFQESFRWSSSLLSIAQCPEGSYHEVYYSLVLLFISFCPSPSFFFFSYFSLKEFSSSLTCVVYFCQFVIISVVLYFQLLET